MLLNAYHEPLAFTLPEASTVEDCAWELLMNTERADGPKTSGSRHAVGSTYSLEGRALALFRRVGP